MVIGYSIGQCSSRETMWEGELYHSAVHVKDPLKSGFMKKLGMFWSEGRHQADAIRGRLPFIHPSSKPLSPHFIYKVQMGFTGSYNWFLYYTDGRRAETLCLIHLGLASTTHNTGHAVESQKLFPLKEWSFTSPSGRSTDRWDIHPPPTTLWSNHNDLKY